MSEKLIRVGVIGVGRGHGFARGAGPHLGMQLVALCDTWEEKLLQVGKELNVAIYTEYDKFLEHDMDAVILANYFHEHAPFAIKALQAGKHVMSETSACFTLAQGVALIEAVEKSGKIYMFAENYPYMLFNQEMRRLYKSGLIGEFKYGEGEYVHPMSADSMNWISPGLNHWRNWLPLTYYNTHSLAPIMYITDTWPAKVNGFILPYDPNDEEVFGKTARQSDLASNMTLRMDNGAVVKLLTGTLRGDSVWVRIHGSKGSMENLRTGNTSMVRVRREAWEKDPGEPHERIYIPDFPEHHAAAMRAGHGGGDFFMNHHFAEAIRKNERPYLDVYRGVAMSIVGILAYRSALNDGNTVVVPDFRKKEVRAQYANDDWSPNPVTHRAGDPWPSVLSQITPPPKALAYAKEIWKKVGYTGD